MNSLTASEAMMIDTDVLIDYLRGKADAVEFIEGLTTRILISSITVAELYAAVREGNERTALDQFISAFEFVPIDAAIAVEGGLFRRDFGKSHNVGLTDAIIAASAKARNAVLVTLNSKHFPMSVKVIVPDVKF